MSSEWGINKWNIGHLATEVASSRSEVAPRWLTEMRRETQLISLYDDINAVDNFMARSLQVSRACNDRESQTPLLVLPPPRAWKYFYARTIIQRDNTVENTIFRRREWNIMLLCRIDSWARLKLTLSVRHEKLNAQTSGSQFSASSMNAMWESA